MNEVVISTAIISDNVQGALAMSIFDFFACFFVLYFISFFIRAISYFDEKYPSTPDNSSGEK